jgi:hypothetical protein
MTFGLTSADKKVSRKPTSPRSDLLAQLKAQGCQDILKGHRYVQIGVVNKQLLTDGNPGIEENAPSKKNLPEDALTRVDNAQRNEAQRSNDGDL